jgi:hypothetical protein
MRARKPTAARKPIIATEAVEQQRVFEWAELQANIWPPLRWMYAVPNGGSRNYLEAVRLKRQGVKPGVPDICLPYPSGRYHGLYIEMKRADGGKKSDHQKAYIEYLQNVGYKAVFCSGFEQAVDEIKRYMKGGA